MAAAALGSTMPAVRPLSTAPVCPGKDTAMYAYVHLQLAELHLDPVSTSLTASRRAAHRFAELESLRDLTDESAPKTRPPLVGRLLSLVRAPA
jgi:hypothetical protein